MCLSHHFQNKYFRSFKSGFTVFRAIIKDAVNKKKEKKIFLIFKEIQNGAVTKSYMRKGFLIYEEMRKYLIIYEEAVSHI